MARDIARSSAIDLSDQAVDAASSNLGRLARAFDSPANIWLVVAVVPRP
ncbi:MAG TPA: hypothetical protein VFN67_38915 [Polyangiales bacterium]|nr:hypothetical protein [Polyangiales bacterium]